MDVPIGFAINSHRAGLQLSSQSGSHGTREQPDAIAFKRQLESCLTLFRALVEIMVRSTKESAFAGPYFHPIIRKLDSDLVRFEIWLSDVGANEPDFGRSTQAADLHLELTRYITTILKDLQSQLEDSGRQVEKMRSLVLKMSGRRFNDLILNRQLRALIAKFDEECQKVNLVICNLVKLTEAFQIELATKIQSGPYVKVRQRHLGIMGQTLKLPLPIHIIAEGESSASSHDVDTPTHQDPWSRKTLLSLDEGGAGSFSTVLILKALMAEVAVQEQTIEPKAYSSAVPLTLKPRAVRHPEEELQQQLRLRETTEHIEHQDTELSRYLPCHYFDYTISTGYGGLIAIMLSCLRMNVEDILEEFKSLLDSFWSQSRVSRLRLPVFWRRNRYEYEVFGLGIKAVLRRRTPDANEYATFKQHNDDTSRCIVVRVTPTENLLFRSYHHSSAYTAEPMTRKKQGNLAKFDHETISQVARATIAPSYLTSIALEEGIKASKFFCVEPFKINPSREGYETVKEASGSNPTSCISIGSGSSLESGERMAREERVHMEMEGIKSTRGLNFYSRFNVKGGLADVLIDEWKGIYGVRTLDYVREETEEYLNSDSVKKEITETAKFLVETRRARATTDHWEYFCHGVEYVCTMTRCPDVDSVYRRRDELRRHLEDVHRMESSTIETVLDQGKRFPLYEAKSNDD